MVAPVFLFLFLFFLWRFHSCNIDSLLLVSRDEMKNTIFYLFFLI